MGEQGLCKAQVRGSNPRFSTTKGSSARLEHSSDKRKIVSSNLTPSTMRAQNTERAGANRAGVATYTEPAGVQDLSLPQCRGETVLQ